VNQTIPILVKKQGQPIHTVQIPVTGTINGGGFERAFCRFAHRSARGEVVAYAICPNLDCGRCKLTNYTHLCLFSDLNAPVWGTIQKSITREGG